MTFLFILNFFLLITSLSTSSFHDTYKGWSLYEQVYIAALEYGDIQLLDMCSEALNKQFPDSIRVKRLLGMQYEFNKEYNKALELYQNLLTVNPSNLLLLKRKVFIIVYFSIFCCVLFFRRK